MKNNFSILEFDVLVSFLPSPVVGVVVRGGSGAVPAISSPFATDGKALRALPALKTKPLKNKII